MASKLTKRLIPLFDRVLVRRIAAEPKSIGGIILPENAQEKTNQGEVVAVGQGSRTADGKTLPMTVSVGDTVLLHEFGGNNVKIDGEELVIFREQDLLGILKKA
eukprot:CAMPEP_0177670432 /NCGR_PEP_ID=MMETSP0447-20121125/24082_1 /TAXON_ID=0 /ORGANISM="Stygamoeba regulata, Strain BSH-02190019" /LENGTH=103 /DNA_ID=CAMNT_0019177587 /DNA_START=28 /DNA_END=339 /DNA_ORIENTATION=-